MTLIDAGVVIAACLAIYVAAVLAEKLCWVLIVRRHKHDGLQDPRVLRPNRDRVDARRASTR